MRIIGLLFFCFLIQSCSILYYNPKTGVEHVWGFGHLQNKTIPDNDTKAIAIETKTIGLNIRLGQQKYSVGLGYNRQTKIHIPDPSKPVAIFYKDGELFDAQLLEVQP